MGAGKRRSERLALTIPLLATGVDAQGAPFEEEARAYFINRHGARVNLLRALQPGQSVHLVNPLAQTAADFRVVSRLDEDVNGSHSHYGVECAGPEDNFWRILFPAAGEDRIGAVEALLDCSVCHTTALLPLEISELETLRALGRIVKPCPMCLVETPWSYADLQIVLTQFDRWGKPKAEPPGWASDMVVDPTPRRHRRAVVHVPVEIRDESGATKKARTVNLSREGLAFSNSGSYREGQGIEVRFPWERGAEDLWLAARVVRVQEIESSSLKICGARFEARAEISPVAA